MTYRIFLLACLCLLFTLPAAAQFEAGLKVGLATGSLEGERYEFSADGGQDLLLALEDANYGFQFGAFMRIPFGERFGVLTEATLNSARTDFQFTNDRTGVTEVFRERYNDLNIPVLASWKFGALRLHAGPVGHLFVSSTSDLRDADGRERTFDTFNLGYAIGGGLHIGKVVIDLRYDGNFSRYGEDFAVAGETFRVDQAPRRWIGSVGYKF